MILLCLLVLATAPNCSSDFLYEQYPYYWMAEDIPAFDNSIATDDYNNNVAPPRFSRLSAGAATNHRHQGGHRRINRNESDEIVDGKSPPVMTSETENMQDNHTIPQAQQQEFMALQRHNGNLLESLLELDYGLMPALEAFSTDIPLFHGKTLDYFDYGDDVEIFDYNNNSAIKAMLSQLISNSSCTQNGGNDSVMCCTFSMDNTSNLSTVCSNETRKLHGHTRLTRDICPERSWEPLLNLICVPTLCAFGLCGNTISFLVMCSSAYRRRSYGHYLRALAVFDNLTLIINLIFTLNDVTFDLKEFHASNATYTGFMSYHTSASCKITEFMRHVIYLMSSWLVVCFTVDRFIAVCFPLLRVRYCTERCAIYTTFIVLAAVMLSQTYHLVFVERLDRDLSPHFPCHAPNHPNPSVRLTYFGLNYFWFSFLLRFTLPFLAIAMCNGCIIYHIARMRKGRRSKETRRKQKASLAIYTLYAVCACFVITVLPNAIISIIQFSAFFINHQIMDSKLYCLLKTVYTPFHVLRLVNYSANCVLYGVAGRQFRHELYKLFRCCVGRNLYDKRSIQSPEPIALKADLLLTSRKNGNTVIRMK